MWETVARGTEKIINPWGEDDQFLERQFSNKNVAGNYIEPEDLMGREDEWEQYDMVGHDGTFGRTAEKNIPQYGDKDNLVRQALELLESHQVMKNEFINSPPQESAENSKVRNGRKGKRGSTGKIAPTLCSNAASTQLTLLEKTRETLQELQDRYSLSLSLSHGYCTDSG
jgi:hypothetical protein